MRHQLAHLACAVGLYKAGEATTYRRRTCWALVAVYGAYRAHKDHHSG